jgi:hypothetical protein
MEGEYNTGFRKKYKYSRFVEQNAGYFIEQELFFKLIETIKFVVLIFVG